MNAGRLRHRVIIEQLVFGDPDPVTGESQSFWAPIFDTPIPAEVLEGPGREPYAAGTIQAETTARINMRWFDVDKHELMRMRVLWDGQVFAIASAERDATARKEWRLRCVDGMNDG